MSDEPPSNEPVSAWSRMRRAVFGAPRNVSDPGIFHKMALIPFLAWIGLGADGLSSSSYGPDESFRTLGPHTYLAVGLALATCVTVFIISWAYSRVIEQFPTGGGGYVVATKLLGSHAGVVSGCALLVDYILTVTVSIAAGGDALFSMPSMTQFQAAKLPVEVAVLILLIVLNLRGVKESVTALMPIFIVFCITHIVLIVGSLAVHGGQVPELAHEVSTGMRSGIRTLGLGGLALVFLRAYSMGGGTYTGIEAVSNGLQIMREPHVQTGKRTMVYMAVSLAFTATGIMVAYLLFRVQPVEGQTLNAVLVNAFAGNWSLAGLPVGKWFVYATLLSEGALLFVAAQTGFIDGPRVMANMAVDSWLPHRFASLSDRLTTKDGVLLMGTAAILVLVGMNGKVDALVVMYAINVFVGFTLSNVGMTRFWIQHRAKFSGWSRKIVIHVIGAMLCAGILTVTIFEKFRQGAWLTLVITGAAIALCVLVRRHYRSVARKLEELNREFEDLPSGDHAGGEPDPAQPTAVLLVGSYGGLGIHSMLAIHRMVPSYFKNVIFVSVAVVDSGTFKGAEEIQALRDNVDANLRKYVALARRLGWNAASATGLGTDPADVITRVCLDLAKVYPRVMFFAGKLIWQRETWTQRILHNETAYQVERRLQWKGLPMTVIPLRIRERARAIAEQPRVTEKIGRVAGAVLLLGAGGALIWRLGVDSRYRALAALPVAARRSTVERMVHKLQVDCAPPIAGSLVDDCRRDADALLAQPECDTACREIAEPLRTRATR
jgi:amino acid transporter